MLSFDGIPTKIGLDENKWKRTTEEAELAGIAKSDGLSSSHSSQGGKERKEPDTIDGVILGFL